MWTLLDLTRSSEVLKVQFGCWNLSFKVDPANPPPLIAPETQEPVPLMVAVPSWDGTGPKPVPLAVWHLAIKKKNMPNSQRCEKKLTRFPRVAVFRRRWPPSHADLPAMSSVWVDGSHRRPIFLGQKRAFEEPSAIGHRLVTTMEVSKSFEKEKSCTLNDIKLELGDIIWWSSSCLDESRFVCLFKTLHGCMWIVQPIKTHGAKIGSDMTGDSAI